MTPDAIVKKYSWPLEPEQIKRHELLALFDERARLLAVLEAAEDLRKSIFFHEFTYDEYDCDVAEEKGVDPEPDGELWRSDLGKVQKLIDVVKIATGQVLEGRE